MEIFHVIIFFFFFSIGIYIRQYINEKAKNLATKEDIASLTNIVEEVKFQFAHDLEKIKLKHQLEANLKKVFQEETVKSIHDINKFLVDVMKYCHGNIAKRHPNEHCVWSNVEDLPDESYGFFTYHVMMDKLIIEHSLYLSNDIQNELQHLSDLFGLLSSMELNFANSQNDEDQMIAYDAYEDGFETIKKCQENIFKILSAIG